MPGGPGGQWLVATAVTPRSSRRPSDGVGAPQRGGKGRERSGLRARPALTLPMGTLGYRPPACLAAGLEMGGNVRVHELSVAVSFPRLPSARASRQFTVSE